MGDTSFEFGANADKDKDRKCFGLMVCPHCGKAVMCCEVESNSTEESMTIPYEPRKQGEGNKQPHRKDQTNGYPWLTAKLLTLNWEPATIEYAKVEKDSIRDRNGNTSGEDCVLVRIGMRGDKKFMWTIRLANPNMEVLVKAFGTEENEWIGKQIHLAATELDERGRQWIRCQPLHEQPTARKRN